MPSTTSGYQPAPASRKTPSAVIVPVTPNPGLSVFTGLCGKGSLKTAS